jgi:hypothetical protein
MLCEAVSIPNGVLQEFSHYLSLARTVVRRLSIVLSCSKRPFIMSFNSCMALLHWWGCWCWLGCLSRGSVSVCGWGVGVRISDLSISYSRLCV